MNHVCRVVACALVGSLAAVAAEKPPKPAGGEPAMVYVELSQVEVDVLKLRRMGIDWKAVAEHESVAGNPAWLRKWAELLVENDLARINASPRLTTMTGRKAVFDVTTTRETVLPRLAEGKIVVEVTLETFDPPAEEKRAADPEARGEQRSSLSTVTTCKPGQTVLLGQDLSTSKNSTGEITAESATLTFLMADTNMPELGKAPKGAPAIAPVDLPLVEVQPLGSVPKLRGTGVPRRR